MKEDTMKLLVVWLAVLFLMAAGRPVFAQQVGTAPADEPPDRMMGGRMTDMRSGGVGRGGHHGMTGRGDRAERPLISLMLRNREELQLTPEQIQRLEVLRSDFQKLAVKRSADIQAAELELKELLSADPVDMAKVESQVKRIEALRGEQRLSRIKTIEEGKALLVPEQRKKLDTLAQKRGRAPTP
jgi:Spy/CpxP family protein refolding chaperone